jgi:hypothetical protein
LFGFRFCVDSVIPLALKSGTLLRTIASSTPIIRERTMKKTRLLLCVAALLSHCTTTTYPTSSGDATLSIVNHSSYTIGWVYLSTTAGVLGTDELGTATVSAGASYDITGILAGTYYLRAVHSTTHDTAYKSAVVLTAGETYTWTLTDADFSQGTVTNATIAVVNNSSSAITEVYLSTSPSVPGTSELGSSSLAAGATYNITAVPAGTYYLRSIRLSTHDTAHSAAVTLVAGQTYTWTLTDADFSGGATGNASISVVNNSTLTVGWLFMSVSSGLLGTDQLDTGILAVGNTFNIAAIPVGTYYLRAVHYNLHDTAFKTVTLTGGQAFTWTLTDNSFTPANGGIRKLLVVDSSSFTITAVYASQSNTTWGSNWLGGATISPGASYAISNLPAGYLNIKITTSDSGRYALHLKYLPSGGTDTLVIDDAGLPTTPHGSLKIVNTSSTEIYYLYMRTSGTSTWSDDMLGQSTVPAGQSLQVNVLDPGTYDFRVESYSGTSAEIDGSDITAGELLTWTVSAMN